MNKKTRDLIEIVAATGEDPVLFLCRVFRDPNNPLAERVRAAQVVARYTHQELPTAVALTVNQGRVLGIDLSGFDEDADLGDGERNCIDVTPTIQQNQMVSESDEA